MKIGILTYHRVYNYGATLQAVALRLFLEKQGHEVSYIDYYPDYHRAAYRAFRIQDLQKKSLREKLYGLYLNLKHYNSRKARAKVYEAFLDKYIVPYCAKREDEQFDVIVYGSDQIWRKQPGMSYHFNPVYFGINGYIATRHISYAASMGGIHLNSSDMTFLKDNLTRFAYVGVRERDLYDILLPLGLSHLKQNIDPTLLLEAVEWDTAMQTRRVIDQPYVIYYKVREGFNEEKIEKWCRDNNKLLIKIMPFDTPKGSSLNPTPADFISLIKYSEMVFTTSFHGLAFSIIYKKDVYVTVNSNSERMRGLMGTLGMGDRFVDANFVIPASIPSINYEIVYERLAEKHTESVEFLLNAISVK